MNRRHRAVRYVLNGIGFLGMLCLLTMPLGCGSAEDGEQPDDGLPPLNIVSEEAADPGSEDAQNDRAEPPAGPEEAPSPDGSSDLKSRQQFARKGGAEFRLLRTVEQALIQSTPTGPVKSQSRFEAVLAITVEEVQPDGRKRLGVKYERVRYFEDLASRTIHYDSHDPNSRHGSGSQHSSSGAWYHRLVDTGFSFWLDDRNRVAEVVGAGGQKPAVGPPSREFVQHALGLWPIAGETDETGSPRQVGDSWTHTRHIRRPLPMRVTNRYTLQRLDGATAEIEFAGTIGPGSRGLQAGSAAGPAGRVVPPAADNSSTAAGKDVWVKVRTGRCFGTCLLRRDLGIPIESRVEYTFDMDVRTANGIEFPQRKRIVTTLRKAGARNEESGVRGQSSGVRGQLSGVSLIPDP